MNEKYGGSCAVLKEIMKLPNIECCSSCHDDVDDGFYTEMCTVYYGDEWFDVCCTVQIAYEKWREK